MEIILCVLLGLFETIHDQRLIYTMYCSEDQPVGTTDIYLGDIVIFKFNGQSTTLETIKNSFEYVDGIEEVIVSSKKQNFCVKGQKKMIP